MADGDWFYLVGIWRHAERKWPECYAILSVAANPEVARYQDRQGAVLLRRQRMDWLDATVPETDILEPPPARSLCSRRSVDNRPLSSSLHSNPLAGPV